MGREPGFLTDTDLATDPYGRRFSYVRLSVTEVCNFRCTYCLPHGYQKNGPLELLSPKEIERLSMAFVRMGMRKVRLTGGEPTTRSDLGQIIEKVAATPGLTKLALTTNGWNLDREAAGWRASGLSHLNVSVDSLDPEVFARVTGHDRLPAVLAGIEGALKLGYRAVKLNAVLLRDTAEAGFADFAAYVRDRPVSVRFIELMRTGDNAAFFADQHVGGQVLRNWLSENGWRLRERGIDDGPAAEYEHPDYAGRLGLIAPYSTGFCDSCNRLRVTAKGKLRLCLFGDGGIDLRDLLQADDQRDELIARVVEGLGLKTAGHRLHEANPGDLLHLSQTGG
jgi:cyclic pyranopterin phosphate synthase